MKRIIHLRWMVILFLGFGLYGCEIESRENFHFTTLSATAADLPEEFVLGEEYEIPVSLLLPDGCTSFEGFESTIGIGNTRKVVAIGVVQTDQACTQAITMEDHSFQISVTFTDTYHFRFYQGQSESGEAEYLEYSIPVVSESSAP